MAQKGGWTTNRNNVRYHGSSYICYCYNLSSTGFGPERNKNARALLGSIGKKRTGTTTKLSWWWEQPFSLWSWGCCACRHVDTMLALDACLTCPMLIKAWGLSARPVSEVIPNSVALQKHLQMKKSYLNDFAAIATWHLPMYFARAAWSVTQLDALKNSNPIHKLQCNNVSYRRSKSFAKHNRHQKKKRHIKNKAYRAWRTISDSILMVRKTKHKLQLIHETTVLRSPKLVEK